MVLLAAGLLIGLLFLYAMMAPSPGAMGSILEAQEIKIPTAEAGSDVPVIFGTRRVQSPNVIWWGDVKSEPIIEEVEVGGGGIFGGSDTEDIIVGYRYYAGMHMILSVGSIDGIKKVWVGDEVAWEEDSGSLGTTSIDIDLPELFGGDRKEGGVIGTVDFEFGLAAQGRNDYLQAQLATDCPAFRLLSGVVLRQVYFGTSSHPKPWSFVVQRTSLIYYGTGGAWNNTKEVIGDDINPIHIIRNVLISQEYGKGVSTSYIDDTSFFAAADTLYDEGFGLSFYWSNDVTPDDFILEILRHIDGVMYQNMSTGQYVISLARDDYTVSALDLYDEDDIQDVYSFTRPGLVDVINEVTVRFHNVDKNEDDAVTVHNLALIDAQNLIVPSTYERPGITDRELANAQASKLLQQNASMLATMNIKGNRNMSGLKPNDMIKVSWALYGMVEIPLRVLKVDYGDLEDGTVTLGCTEDIFSAGEGVYTTPEDSLWTTPTNAPEDPTYFNIVEMPYQHIIDRGFRTQLYLDALNDDQGLAEISVAKSTVDAIDYQLYLRDGPADSFKNYGSKSFIPTATLAGSAGLAQDAEEVTIDVEGVVDLTSVQDASWGLLGTEMVEVISVDTANSQITIKRGLFDTVPTEWVAGTRIWFLYTNSARMSALYEDGDTPAIKPLARTSQGTYDYDSAAIKTMTPAFDSRIIRPYAPGNFKLNTVSYPISFAGEAALTWSHRNRKTQLGTVVDASEAGAYSLETDAYYTLKIYKVDSGGSTLLRTVSPITNAFYTYAELEERSDGGLASADPLHSSLRFVLSSHRVDSSAGTPYDSWQEIDFTSDRV